MTVATKAAPASPSKWEAALKAAPLQSISNAVAAAQPKQGMYAFYLRPCVNTSAKGWASRGQTDNLKKRLGEHQRMAERYGAAISNVRFVYTPGLTSTARRRAEASVRRGRTDKELELSEPVRWYLDADRLAELDEEYRQRNRQFRRYVLKTILANPSHPLRGIVTGQNRFTKLKSLLFDAGHVVPVKTLAQRGTTLERLAVQDRSLNRSAGARAMPKIVNVGGVPIDVETLRAWARRPGMAHLANFVHKAGIRGWSSVSGKVLDELSFVIGDGGRAFVRREPAGKSVVTVLAP